ncbi:MAG: hypothetical protein K9L30_15170 [Desulfobacterales bacterium]|nr:hypothetical protein [Desulfobacterales bacterium]
MNFEISFIEEKGYFIIKTSGDTSPDDVENSLKQLFDNKNWCAGKNVLYDNRHEDLGNLSNNDVQKISEKFIKLNDYLNNSKVALVMPKDLAFGIARMWEAHTEFNASFTACVFRTIYEAENWIEKA